MGVSVLRIQLFPTAHHQESFGHFVGFSVLSAAPGCPNGKLSEIGRILRFAVLAGTDTVVFPKHFIEIELVAEPQTGRDFFQLHITVLQLFCSTLDLGLVDIVEDTGSHVAAKNRTEVSFIKIHNMRQLGQRDFLCQVFLNTPYCTEYSQPYQ